MKKFLSALLLVPALAAPVQAQEHRAFWNNWAKGASDYISEITLPAAPGSDWYKTECTIYDTDGGSYREVFDCHVKFDKYGWLTATQAYRTNGTPKQLLRFGDNANASGDARCLELNLRQGGQNICVSSSVATSNGIKVADRNYDQMKYQDYIVSGSTFSGGSSSGYQEAVKYCSKAVGSGLNASTRRANSACMKAMGFN